MNSRKILESMLYNMYYFEKKGIIEKIPSISITGFSHNEYLFNRWKIIRQYKYHPDPKVKKDYHNLVKKIKDDIDKNI